MSDGLVERVARAMCASVEARTSDVNVVRALGYGSVEAFIDAAWPNYAPEARTAIALLRPAIRAEALEEAAKVCDAEAERYWDGGHGFRDGTALDCAAAIRALVKEPT